MVMKEVQSLQNQKSPTTLQRIDNERNGVFYISMKSNSTERLFLLGQFKDATATTTVLGELGWGLNEFDSLFVLRLADGQAHVLALPGLQ